MHDFSSLCLLLHPLFCVVTPNRRGKDKEGLRSDIKAPLWFEGENVISFVAMVHLFGVKSSTNQKLEKFEISLIIFWMFWINFLHFPLKAFEYFRLLQSNICSKVCMSHIITPVWLSLSLNKKSSNPLKVNEHGLLFGLCVLC